MDGTAGDGGAPDRRSRVIVKLVAQYEAAPEPDKWLQALTLKALRALDNAKVSLVEKSPARREIHAISREVVSQARASALLRKPKDQEAIPAVIAAPPAGSAALPAAVSLPSG